MPFTREQLQGMFNKSPEQSTPPITDNNTGAELPMVAPDGSFVNIREGNLQNALKLGYAQPNQQQLAQIQQVKQRAQDEQTYGGLLGSVGAGVAGFARGASFGLSDLAAKGIDKATGTHLTDTLNKLKDVHPYLSTAGELGGFVADPAAILEKAGLGIAEKKGLGLLADKAASTVTSDVAKKVVEGTVRGAGEGAIIGIAGGVSQLSLNTNPNETIQHLLADAGHEVIGNILLGGGIGATIPVLAEGLKFGSNKLLSGAQTAGNVMKEPYIKTASGIQETLHHTPAAEVEKVMRDNLNGVNGKPSPQKIRDFAANLETSIQSSTDKGKDIISMMKQNQERELPAWLGENGARKSVADINAAYLTNPGSETIFGKIEQAIDDWKTVPSDYSKPLLTKFETLYKDVQGKFLDATTPAEQFHLVDNFKRNVYDLLKFDHNIPVHEQKLIAEAKVQVGRVLQQSLEDANIWGQEAAGYQRITNAAASDFLRTTGNLVDKGGAFAGGKLEKAAKKSGLTADQTYMSSKKINTFVKNADLETHHEINDLLTDHHNSIKNLEDTYFAITGKKVGASTDIGSALQGLDSWKTQLGNSRAAKEIEKTLGGSLTDHVLGYASLVHPVTAGPAFAAKKLLADPVSATRYIYSINAAGEKVNKIITDAVDAYVKGDKYKVIDKITKGAIAASGAINNARFHEIYKQLSENLPAVESRLTNSLAPMAAMDQKLGEAAKQNYLKTYSFLQTKLPQPSTAFRMNMDKNKKFEPTQVQKAAFTRYYRAATEPLSVVSDLVNGNVSKEGIETLQTLYPSIYEQMKNRAAYMIKNNEVDFSKKASLRKVFGLNLDGSYAPNHIKGIQAIYSQQQGNSGGSSGGSVKPISGAYQTDAQRLEAK